MRAKTLRKTTSSADKESKAKIIVCVRVLRSNSTAVNNSGIDSMNVDNDENVL